MITVDVNSVFYKGSDRKNLFSAILRISRIQIWKKIYMCKEEGL